MKEIEDLKKLALEAATIMAAVEENKELIGTLGTYATTSIDSISKFLQGNIESIISVFTIGLVNTWGDNLKLRCQYIGEARKILVDSGFTPEEAYDILKDKNKELHDTVNDVAKAIKESRTCEEISQEDKTPSKESGRGTNNRRVEVGN